MDTENIIFDIKKGKSFNSISKKYKVSWYTIKKIAEKNNISSKYVKISDEKILEVINKRLVATNNEILDDLNFSSFKNMKRRLDNLKLQNKIKTTVIPSTSHRKKNHHIFNNYTNTLLYYIDKKDLEIWVRNKLPDALPQNFRKAITRRLHDLGLDIDLVEKTEYRVISFTTKEYKILSNKAQKQKKTLKEYILGDVKT
jgi:hypothetical protein